MSLEDNILADREGERYAERRAAELRTRRHRATLPNVAGQAMDRLRIAACLAWYDEPPEFLTRCVESLLGLADMLVAIDGPWVGFPNDSVCSPVEQHAALLAAAQAARVELVPGLTASGWSSQVQKRDYLMRYASGFADWLFVIDADEWICDTANSNGLRNVCVTDTRAMLELTSRDVATVLLQITGDGQPHGARAIRRFYRSPVTVSHAHNGYNHRGRWLHGDPTAVALEVALPTPIIVNHEPNARGTQRNAAAALYRAHRRRNQTEHWRPAE